MSHMIRVEVVFALPQLQRLVELEVPVGTSAQAALGLSGLVTEFPAWRLEEASLGLFGEAFGTKGLPVAEEYVLQAGDRVEVYRPLTCDPKDVRRRRAAKLVGGGA